MEVVPAFGHQVVLCVTRRSWTERGRMQVHGHAVFVMARPDGREV